MGMALIPVLDMMRSFAADWLSQPLVPSDEPAPVCDRVAETA
jgi:hypothetical protein